MKIEVNGLIKFDDENYIDSIVDLNVPMIGTVYMMKKSSIKIGCLQVEMCEDGEVKIKNMFMETKGKPENFTETRGCKIENGNVVGLSGLSNYGYYLKFALLE